MSACSACGSTSAPGAVYCAVCGALLADRCPRCGDELERALEVFRRLGARPHQERAEAALAVLIA